MTSHAGIAVIALLPSLSIGVGPTHAAQPSSSPELDDTIRVRALSITAEDVDRGWLKDAIVVIDREPALGEGDPISSIETELWADGAIVGSAVLFEYAGHSAEIRAGLRYRLLRLAEGHNARSVAARLSSVPGVTAEAVVVGRQMSAWLDPGDRPNDPLFGDQYALENVGQVVNGVAGMPNADIRVVDAWARQTGSPEVTIAVIDAGVSSTHPDLAPKLVPGYNIFGPDHSNTDALFNAHGTQVAGVAAAVSNNSQGVTGVSWGSMLMPVVAANVLGFTSDAWLAEGLVWAVDNDADVVIMSFGLGNPSTVLRDAVRYAEDEGVAVFASTGNTGEDRVFYPAAYPETIAVGATDSMDQVAGFSNRGPQIDVVAPGVSVYTCYHTVQNPDTYVFASGTSVATPMVAGVAALLLSADPTLSPSLIRDAIRSGADDLGAPGWDPASGFGRLNAQRSLRRALGEGTCLADINGDGRLDQADFAAWIAAYNDGSLRADQNRNGAVDPGDFAAFVSNLLVGYGCAPDTAGS
ncbi:MAG: S8 family serine peptidase [Phycisphaerales bacterium]